MPKIKTYGPSNDEVPEEELFLAAIIQNAKAFDMKPTKGANWRDANGRADPPREEVAKVCAIGARDLFHPPWGAYGYGVVSGNDDKNDDENDESFCTGYTVGQSFQHAMK